MAIDRIPGVGPTNADIATAVAAPSAATIAAAVAAPSAATIASTVAGSVPTLSQITSTVQANAGSPFGGTWTTIASGNAAGTSSLNLTGLSGYKFLKLNVFGWVGAADIWQIRINGDSSFIYYWQFYVSTNSGGGRGAGNNIFRLSPTATSQLIGFIDFPNSNSTTSRKFYNGECQWGNDYLKQSGWWDSNSAISSLTIFSNGGTNFSNFYYALLGAN